MYVCRSRSVLKIYMPRGSVLLFTGGLIHGSGAKSAPGFVPSLSWQTIVSTSKTQKNESRFSFLAGVNSTNVGRKSLLSSFLLGWLRPEYKFWAHKELHNALSDGKMKPELTVHSYIQFRRLALPEGVGVVCLSRACLGKSSRFIA